MRNLDILAAENGEHIRVLLCGEEQCYVVSCQHFRMPYPVASDLLAELQPVPAETYSVFVLDEDITNRQREGRNRKLDLIAPLLEDACIYDKSHRNEVVRQIAAEHGIARRTVLQYLWRYWVSTSFLYSTPSGQNSFISSSIVPLQPFRVNGMVTRMFDFSPVVAKHIADCARTKLLGTRHHNHSLLVGGHAPSDCGLKCTAKASSTFSLHLLCHTRYGSFPGNSHRPCGLTLPKGRDPSGLPAADKTRLPSVRGRGPHRDDFSSSLPL